MKLEKTLIVMESSCGSFVPKKEDVDSMHCSAKLGYCVSGEVSLFNAQPPQRHGLSRKVLYPGSEIIVILTSRDPSNYSKISDVDFYLVGINGLNYTFTRNRGCYCSSRPKERSLVASFENDTDDKFWKIFLNLPISEEEFQELIKNKDVPIFTSSFKAKE